MDDLVPANLHDGESAVMQSDYGLFELSNSTPDGKDAGEWDHPSPFRDRFETIRMTPRGVSDAVVEEDGVFKGLFVDGERYSLSQRFLKELA